MVAYSGGVDSAFLAATAHRVLGERMLAVLADSPSLARRDMEQACAFAQSLAMPLEVIATEELDRPEYARNDANRCFHCKDELFAVMEKLGAKLGIHAHRLRDECRRHAGLSPRTARGGGARRAGAAGRGGSDQAGSARTGESGRLPGVGPAGGALPFVARGIRTHGDARGSGAGGTRRREPAAAGISRAARSPPRRTGARGDCARRTAARADHGDDGRDHGGAEAGGIQVRDAGLRGASARAR